MRGKFFGIRQFTSFRNSTQGVATTRVSFCINIASFVQLLYDHLFCEYAISNFSALTVSFSGFRLCFIGAAHFKNDPFCTPMRTVGTSGYCSFVISLKRLILSSFCHLQWTFLTIVFYRSGTLQEQERSILHTDAYSRKFRGGLRSVHVVGHAWRHQDARRCVRRSGGRGTRMKRWIFRVFSRFFVVRTFLTSSRCAKVCKGRDGWGGEGYANENDSLFKMREGVCVHMVWAWWPVCDFPRAKGILSADASSHRS